MKWILPLLASLLLAGCATDDPDRMLMKPDAADTTTADVGGEPDTEEDTGDDGGGPGTADMGRDEPDTERNADVPPSEDTDNPAVCRPDRDGTIRRGEVPLEVGLSAKFMVAEEISFDTAGTIQEGERVWDLAQEFAGDHLEVTELRDPSGEWFETTFPTATYFTTLSTNSDLYGVFELTDDALLLLGVVSPEEGFYRTELEYDPAIPVLQFPLEEGNTWSVESDVSGVFDGTVVVYDEVYDFEVDARGVLKTAFGNFQVLRVRSTLDRQVGFVNTIVRSFAFVTECFGTVATVNSQEDEESVEFTEVSELRRIAP